MNATPTGRGPAGAEPASRRRGEALEQAILHAVLVELAEVGYAKLTIDGVARRAQTSTPVLYRRWPSRAGLVLAAVGCQASPAGEIPDSGDLRADLLAHLRRVAQRFDGVLGEAVRGLLVETLRDDELSTLLQAQVGRLTSQAEIVTILQRAADRKDIDPGAVTPRVVALPLDLLRNEVVVRGTPVPDAAVVGILDDIVLPLLTGVRAGNSARSK
jgi:AcrR family transcriptional regulator